MRALDKIGAAKPIIAIIGPPAAGKTKLRERLAEALNLPSFDIEEEGEPGTERWVRLLDRLAAEPSACIVESCVSPRPYRAMLRERGCFLIKVAAPSAERLRRLRQRGYPTPELKRIWKTQARLPKKTADARWNGLRWSEDEFEALAAKAQAHPQRPRQGPPPRPANG